jgi:hypothetical protein
MITETLVQGHGTQPHKVSVTFSPQPPIRRLLSTAQLNTQKTISWAGHIRQGYCAGTTMLALSPSLLIPRQTGPSAHLGFGGLESRGNDAYPLNEV